MEALRNLKQRNGNRSSKRKLIGCGEIDGRMSVRFRLNRSLIFLSVLHHQEKTMVLFSPCRRPLFLLVNSSGSSKELGFFGSPPYEQWPLLYMTHLLSAVLLCFLRVVENVCVVERSVRTEDVWGVLSLFHLWSLFLNSLHFQDFTVDKKQFTTVTHLDEKFVLELTDFIWCCYGSLTFN